jgi:hypothetical protein
MDLIKETLVAAEEVIKFAASVAVPPPGGTIIAAAIAITAMVIKGEAINGNTVQGPRAYCTWHTWTLETLVVFGFELTLSGSSPHLLSTRVVIVVMPPPSAFASCQLPHLPVDHAHNV